MAIPEEAPRTPENSARDEATYPSIPSRAQGSGKEHPSGAYSGSRD